jgi:uncharacterized protein (TIGR03435 family)
VKKICGCFAFTILNIIVSLGVAYASSHAAFNRHFVSPVFQNPAGLVEKTMPTFRTISVKRNVSNDAPFRLQILGDGIRIKNAPLLTLVLEAYGTTDSGEQNVFGLPEWVKNERYDIEARVDESNIAQFQTLPFDQQLSMMRSILESRFQMRAHVETREKPVYGLVTLRKGIVKEPLSLALTNSVAALGYKAVSEGNVRLTGGARNSFHLIGHAISMPSLAGILSQKLDRPVLDRTELSGTYNFDFTWTQDVLGLSPQSEEEAPASTLSADPPSLFTALQEQVGLKLIAQKGTVPVLVVDHIEHPTAN